MKKQKYYCLQRDFIASNQQFSIHIIKAVDIEEAWNIVETTMATRNSHEWLMSKAELTALKKALK